MQTTRVTVLGGGRVGSAIARDLAASDDFAVTVVDVSPDTPERFRTWGAIDVKVEDLTNPARVQSVVGDADLVVGAVPGSMGYATLRSVIDAGRNVVDISFFEEDPFSLDALARERGVTAVMDCGVAPGLSNMVLGHWLTGFDRLDRFECLVGGLPEAPQPPWNYKAPYSPSDVIEMYTRPARFRRDGREVTMPALSEPETLQFPGIGALEAFNTDGLRTLLHTCDVPNLVERTLRYPGHRRDIELLQQSGLFSTQPRRVGEGQVVPLQLTSELLFEQWFQGPEDHDMTVLRLRAQGERHGERQSVQLDLVDRFDRDQGISSMARTTGYPCASVVRLLARGDYSRPGISPPEWIGREASCYDAVLEDLRSRGIVLREVPQPPRT
jgi:saccharopine dehydrogenase-like NADP-dependent oxidoreductase